MAIEVYVQVVVLVIVAFAPAQGVLRRSAAIVDTMNKAFLLERFERTVDSDAIGWLHSFLQVGEADGRRLLQKEVQNQQAHGRWVDIFRFQ